MFTKLKTLFYERKYNAYNTRIKYMFFSSNKKNVDTLVVVFPACSPNSARYNYVSTIKDIECNKLFLLDDFATNHQGCYFITPNEERCAIDLINNIIEQCAKRCDDKHLQNIVFVGSSKGAYMALNMSLEISNVKLIIGSPKYFLGTNLNKDDTIINLRLLVGDPVTEEGIKRLDLRLKNKILNSRIKPVIIYFHYSDCEHTYSEHVKFLLQDIKDASISLIEDVQHYPTHREIVNFFPPYLVNTLKAIVTPDDSHC